MISILGYGCTSSAGIGVETYWRGLREGIDHSEEFCPAHEIPERLSKIEARARNLGQAQGSDPVGVAPPKACLWPEGQQGREGRLVKDFLVDHLVQAWQQAQCQRGQTGSLSSRIGVIFASTKGCLEDFIWDPDESSLRKDPLTPCLESFLVRSRLKAHQSLSLSNACASSHSALFLADRWINQGRVDQVLVLAGEAIGPFVLRGFQALGALSETTTRAFSADRDGLRLGEAAAAVLVGPGSSSGFWIDGIGVESEGFALIRPSVAGMSLRRAILTTLNADDRLPDLIIAHGTGTNANDSSEDHAFTSVFKSQNSQSGTPPITGSKWSIGHTLGASGLMDVIAACEALRRREVFLLRHTDEIDPQFSGRYLSARTSSDEAREVGQSLHSVLVTSLGFGGVNATLRVGLTA